MKKISVNENKHCEYHINNDDNSKRNNILSNNEFFNMKNFKDNLHIEVRNLNLEELVLDVKGIDAPIANAIRRILISEIPTIAIENCIFYQNTSVIPDEVLAHRLGLIPINVDADLFSYKSEDEEANEFNSVKFKLHIICPNNKEFINIYSRDLKWIPQGNQGSRIIDAKSVHPDILIAKLKQGQEIEIDLICTKGIGKTHAKWSPVSTAYYRLIPDIKITKSNDIKNEKAEKLVKLCPVGVFDIEDSGYAYVKDSRKCTMCRECIRHEEYTSSIDLGKLKDCYECKCLKFINLLINK